MMGEERVMSLPGLMVSQYGYEAVWDIRGQQGCSKVNMLPLKGLFVTPGAVRHEKSHVKMFALLILLVKLLMNKPMVPSA